ncbi:uncharacterized protein PRCAT00000238001 [Priceomyces carsonii]|uniref:uncharacterized protein n=1 Tax=Priceomyces carsonii TaxID=28549 RepID=UPI002ED8A3C7|nr:unnamed protein product [Priceomyces carsonii]
MQKGNIYEQKLQEKRIELEKLMEFRDLSETLALQLEEVEEKLNKMNSGAESVALVLSNWQNVIRSVSLASLGLMKYTEKDYQDKVPLPESLVRIRLENSDNNEGSIANPSLDAEDSISLGRRLNPNSEPENENPFIEE